MTGTIMENQVVKLWQEFMPGQTYLATEEGSTVRIVYPGRPNDDRGADWRDAVIDDGGDVRRGDIEINVKSSSWWGHRHHQDPLYNRVILHVVYRHDAPGAAVLQNGGKVPTLALEKYIGESTAGRINHDSGLPSRSMPCGAAVSGRDIAFISGILDNAGDRRFVETVANFREASRGMGAGQSLYQGILGALGYSKNKAPMVELAQRMPLDRLTASFPGEEPDDFLTRSQGWLMGMAGLLPSPRVGCRWYENGNNGWVDRLVRAWESSGEKKVTMNAADWNLFKIRPGNFPRRRIAGMSYLLLRYRKEGLLAGMIHRLEEASPDNDGSSLEGPLLVAAEGFWSSNLDLDLPRGRNIPALLGVNRARVIVVNVILPFAVVWSQFNDRPALAEKTMEIYRHYPVLPENTLERHMRRQLGIGRLSVNSARRQQGLIHIYKTLCSQGKCDECPLNRHRC